jgi:hypothetical protein
VAQKGVSREEEATLLLEEDVWGVLLVMHQQEICQE